MRSIIDYWRCGAIDRQEHLDWAKARALEYLDRGEIQKALDSLASDLRKHPNLANHAGIELGYMQLMVGSLNTVDKMRNFINGFY